MFALLPPSPENLATFAAWAVTARRLPVFLAEHARGALRVEVPAGSTLFIPGADMPHILGRCAIHVHRLSRFVVGNLRRELHALTASPALDFA